MTHGLPSRRGAPVRTLLERHPHLSGGVIGVATLPIHAVVSPAASVALAAGAGLAALWLARP